MEVFRSYIPGLAFPYGLIANPLWAFPQMIQTAYYGSIFLVGAWVVLINLLLAKFIGSRCFASCAATQPDGIPAAGSVTVHARPVGMFPVRFTQLLPSFRATSWS